MHQIIAEKQKDIAEVCRRYEVRRLEVFGSAARVMDFDPSKSDVDFLVEYKPPLHPGFFKRVLRLHADLQAVLGYKVDLIRNGTIRNPLRQAYIDKDREVVFEA